MTELITLLSTGKGTWAEVARLIKAQPWERTFIITSDFGKNFTAENAECIVVDTNKDMPELRDEIQQKLNGKIKGLEIGLHITSGSGKEHMALLAALLKLGIGFRLVTVTENGFTEL
ncbi:MAG TPA: hypothetical protein VJH88_01225 [Candidatus Nanoarchaeia archaeon]|nr:hypothetical protein [Candidatus Nanoarchaeia archaeon]